MSNHVATTSLVPSSLQWFLPDVRLRAAVSSQLVLGEVGVVRGRDEVVSQRSPHVLVHSGVVRVENTVLLRQHVHGESVGGHELVLLGCTGQREQRAMKTGNSGLEPVKSVQILLLAKISQMLNSVHNCRLY